jgi:hypothetical protein
MLRNLRRAIQEDMNVASIAIPLSQVVLQNAA